MHLNLGEKDSTDGLSQVQSGSSTKNHKNPPQKTQQIKLFVNILMKFTDYYHTKYLHIWVLF